MSPHNQEVVIRRVDRFLLHKILNHEVANEEIFIERFLESWYSEGDFLRYSISFVALEGDRIVGIIFGSSAYHNVITIDIEVEETHRRQGIAEVMSKMMMNACADGGCILQWDCVESNEASMALVSKLAFTPFKQRPYYWMEIG